MDALLGLSAIAMVQVGFGLALHPRLLVDQRVQTVGAFWTMRCSVYVLGLNSRLSPRKLGKGRDAPIPSVFFFFFASSLTPIVPSQFDQTRAATTAESLSIAGT